MSEKASACEPRAVAGPSREARKRKRSSSSDSTSSSSSSSSSSAGNRKSRRKHKNKRAKRSNSKMDKLMKEVGELKAIINSSNKNCDSYDDCLSIYPDDEFYEQTNLEHERQNSDTFAFAIETKLKEPSVPKTPDSFLKMLSDVQHLGSSSWSEIRYAETQKLYNHTPGFTDLEANEEVKIYDTLRHISNAYKSYAPITYRILKQKVVLQENIRNLLSWAKNTDVNAENLSGKVEELFLKGDFFKISSDLLQLACGHRAESIEMRRDNIIKQVRDPLVKASLNKIPPSVTHIFDSEPFMSTLEKCGGVRKSFWPPKSQGASNVRANQSNHRLSRGKGGLNATVPSRGTPCFRFEPSSQCRMHMHPCNDPLSRGADHLTSNLSQDQAPFVDHYIERKSFQNRGSRPNRGNNRGRGNARRAFRGGQNYNRKQ